MMVDPAILLEQALPIFVLVVATIIGKLIFSTGGVLASGQSLNTSVHCGFSLAQIGEFSFIIASLGMSLGVISSIFISDYRSGIRNHYLYHTLLHHGSRALLPAGAEAAAAAG